MRGAGAPCRRPRDRPATPVSCRSVLPNSPVQVLPMKVGVAKETTPGERRVALVPEALGRLTAVGLEILVEAGAGAGAMIPDQAYTDAGASVVKGGELFAQSDVILKVQ